ncbi:calmodulin-like [Bombyx mandarina]|uniref:Calmodulin-like n=1 Tax=Bombyx mandarina TaxID=7092 RepID=A0A6J2KI97_BOMMA|nr:calmodulin-like [Bombyx mandarina]
MAVLDAYNPLHNVSLRFNEHQLKEIGEWFENNAKPQLTSTDGDPIRAITVEKFVSFLNLKKFHRRNFQYPSYAEVMNEVERLKAGALRLLTREQVIYMLNKWVLEPDIKHELCLAFKVFDTEKRGFLEIDELKTIVTSYAEPFSEEETREMLRDANVRGDGNVFYENFVESLFSVAPELYEIKTDYLYEDPNEDPSVPPEPVVVEEPPPVPVPLPIKKPKNKKKQ